MFENNIAKFNYLWYNLLKHTIYDNYTKGKFIMAYTFISYSTKNQVEADTILKILKDSGFETWMAPWNIPVGEKYASVINQAIRNCTCFLLLLSDASQNSTWVAKEVERAINYGKFIIPIKLDNVVLNDEFEFYISNAHLISLPKVELDCAEMKQILKVLKNHLGVTEQAVEKPVQTEQVQPEIKKPEEKSVTTPAKPVKNTATKQAGPKQTETSSGSGKTIKYKNGDSYTGGIVNDKRSGKGKYVWKNGDVYQGDFVNDKRSGKGKFTWKNGDVYQGDFINDKRSGKGKMTWKNGNVYTGDFINDKRTGKGKLTFKNGMVYVGDFINDKRTGKGKLTWPNGNVYNGDFVNDKRTGKGKFTWANGDVYQGDFIDDKRTGKGKMTWANGNVYQGDFVNDKRTGTGKLTYANGRVQSGKFLDNKFIG